MAATASSTNDVKLLQHIIANNQTGIVLLEAVRDEEAKFIDFTFALINEPGAAILGHSADSLLGKRYLSHFTQAESSGLSAVYREVLDTGLPRHLSEVPYDADLVSGWFDLQISRYNDAVLVTFTNITSLKRAVLQTQRQNRFLDSLFSASQEAIFVLEAVHEPTGNETTAGPIIDFRYTRINPRFEEVFGVRAAAIVGQLYLTLYPRTKAVGLFDQFCRIVATGQPYHQEVFYDGEGLYGWYELTVTKLDDGLVGSSKDITARKLVEMEQRQQATFLSQVLQTTPSGIITYQAIRAVPRQQNLPNESRPPDADGPPNSIIDFQPIFFNAAYEAIFGETADVIQNRTFRERFDGETDKELFLVYQQVVQTDTPFRRERYYQRIGKWLDLTVTKLDDGFLAIVNDISDRRRAEAGQRQQAEALQQANQELARSNENLQQFAYVASHDLQEPLRKIQAFGSLLKEQYAPSLGEDGIDMLSRMDSAASRMSILIRDLLALSRLTTQQRTYQPQALNAIVESVLTVLDLRIQETEAVIDVGPLGTVVGDATQLTQLFQNLLSNALKFSRLPNGAKSADSPARHPHIRISRRQVNQADLPAGFRSVSGSSAYGVIDVSDDGIGFNAAQAEWIFGAFQRLHGRSEYPGTGIGLAIAKRVVENHRGYIEAESQPGQGAIFRVYLPAD